MQIQPKPSSTRSRSGDRSGEFSKASGESRMRTAMCLPNRSHRFTSPALGCCMDSALARLEYKCRRRMGWAATPTFRVTGRTLRPIAIVQGFAFWWRDHATSRERSTIGEVRSFSTVRLRRRSGRARRFLAAQPRRGRRPISRPLAFAWRAPRRLRSARRDRQASPNEFGSRSAAFSFCLRLARMR